MKYNNDHNLIFVNGYPMVCPQANSMPGLSGVWRTVYDEDTVYCAIMPMKDKQSFCVRHGRPVRTCQAIFGDMREDKITLVGWACPECHAVFPTMATCNEVADG